MRAAVYQQYGPPDVVELRDVDQPIPKENEVLIRIHATTVTSADWRARSLEMPAGFGPISRLIFGISKPRKPILGMELAGQIEAVGSGVRKLNVADRVFAFCGAGLGCHAEYKAVSEDGLVTRIPDNLPYDEAGALSFGGTSALHFLRKADLRKGERVLINGASGAVGTAAVQLARYFGADVTGVCSTANVELVRDLGAADVVDYTREDFTRNGKSYDVIMDTVGTVPWSRGKGSLSEGGRLLSVSGGLPELLRVPWVSVTSGKKLISGVAAVRQEDLRFLAELAEAGEFRPVIDRRFPLERIAEAHRYVDTGRKKGNVIITVAEGD